MSSQAWLDDRLQAVVQSGFPGVAAAAVAPGFRWEGAAGLADVESAAPLTPDHRFNVGSVSKTFLATIVLQLVEEEALALDQDAGPIVDGVTIRQLLNHTSGLPDFVGDLIAFFEPYRKNRAHRWELGPRELLKLVRERPVLFQPGSGWSYSNSNYLMLRLIVEEATGETLTAELRRRILEPLGLAATELPEGPSSATGLARGYLPPDNPLIPGPGLVDVTELEAPFAWAGGGIVSTCSDIARFLQGLLGGDLLAPDLRAEMLRTVPSDWEESDAYGLGIEQVTSLMGMAPSPCGLAWGHLGFSPGYTTIALASDDGERQVVVMANGLAMSEEPWEPLGEFVWGCYCAAT